MFRPRHVLFGHHHEQRVGLEDGEAIEHRMLSGAIERAQKRVEGRNFDIRKTLLKFDDVMNNHIGGLEISALSADLYGDGRDDLTLFYFKEGANFAGVYTTSKVTSARKPRLQDMKRGLKQSFF